MSQPSEMIEIPPYRKQKSILFIAFLLIVIIGLQIYSIFPRTHWEYTIQDIPDDSFSDQMNSLGHQGWQLVFARRASDGDDANSTMDYEVIMERPVR